MQACLKISSDENPYLSEVNEAYFVGLSAFAGYFLISGAIDAYNNNYKKAVPNLVIGSVVLGVNMMIKYFSPETQYICDSNDISNLKGYSESELVYFEDTLGRISEALASE